MLAAFSVTNDAVALVAAFGAAMAGILTAYAAVVRAKKEGKRETEQRLEECRKNVEDLYERVDVQRERIHELEGLGP